MMLFLNILLKFINHIKIKTLLFAVVDHNVKLTKQIVK